MANHTVHIYAPVYQMTQGIPREDCSFATFSSPDASDSYWIYLLSREIEFTLPSRDVLIPKQVATLRAAMAKVDLRAAEAKKDLSNQIENLLSLAYEAEA